MNTSTDVGYTTTDITVTLPGGRALKGICFERPSPHKSIDDVGGQDDSLGGGNWLCLHGWLDNASTFERLIPHLFSSGPTRLFKKVVALDLAGHGQSDHKNDAYHITDFVSDTIFASQKLFGVSAPFNILGHSLGGGVSMLVAGTLTTRVARLVMLESVGPFTGLESEAPAQLRRALAKPPSGCPTSSFSTVEEAAARRAEKNVVEDKCFTPDIAAVLLRTRGLRKAAAAPDNPEEIVDSSGAVAQKQHDDQQACVLTWSSDPWLLRPTRSYLTEASLVCFASSITAPTLILLAKDGMLKRLDRGPVLRFNGRGANSSGSGSGRQNGWFAGRLRLSPFHFTISFFAACAAMLLRGFIFLTRAAASAAAEKNTKSAHSKRPGKAEIALKGLEFLAPLGRRMRNIRRRAVASLETGGHHPQLTEPEAVAAAIISWASSPSVKY
jgi:pimeloyl-ACP methyl ester carboxylesterase